MARPSLTPSFNHKCKVMKRYRSWNFFAVIQLAAFGLAISAQSSSDASPVEYCHLIKNPAAYDGKQVTLRATYRYGFEWQEIYCLKCRDLGKTWLEIWDPTKKSSEILKKLPNDDGTVNATFTGTFQSSGGPFGDGSYRFRFLLREISQAELLTKSGADPNALPENLRKKVCGSEAKPRKGTRSNPEGTGSNRRFCDSPSIFLFNQSDVVDLRLASDLSKF